MPWCVLRYCKNNSKNVSKSDGIAFHRFPRPSNEKREQWIKFVQNNRSEETWLPSDYSYICSLHFRENDKYITKGGKTYLKKSAVPYDDKYIISTHDANEPISESVSESESVLDTPREIILKHTIQNLTLAKKRITVKFKKVQRQNRYLRKKCESLKKLVKSLKYKISNRREADSSKRQKLNEFLLFKGK